MMLMLGRREALAGLAAAVGGVPGSDEGADRASS